ncbi:recombinase family protein [Bacillus sp. CLL-7-23]|uniref:Recombinase family protein n=1 Tax=Bacillus changyiensis TaxID=3004103 RepID=A0ABT4WY95_9BACI|nr:recombinase family protein [Bacillus changyiensis]MDA7025016.1 recombinase family protein [Bacillus changyiensis]
MIQVIFGYVRPFSQDQDLRLQLNNLKQYGCEKIFTEHTNSPKNRPALDNMFRALKSGDSVIVYKLYSIADSTRHLIDIVQFLEKENVFFLSILDQIDTSTNDGKIFFRMMEKVNVFQHDILSESTKAGIYEAKLKGKTGGRPRKPDENVRRALAMYQSKEFSIAQITKATGISKTTLYRYLDH